MSDKVMTTLEEYYQQKVELDHQIATIQNEIRLLKRAMAEKFAPVKIGWIIEDRHLRIRVQEITYLGGYWIAAGKALTKNNVESRRHSGFQRMTIVNLDSPRNSVKIVSKGGTDV